MNPGGISGKPDKTMKSKKPVKSANPAQLHDNFVRGRFKEDISGITADFTCSLDIDKKMADFDIDGSLAHLAAIEKAGIVTKKEKKEVQKALESIRGDIREGRFVFDKKYEDIHMNIEKKLIDMVPESGAKLHTGRSRNDQVSVDFRLYVKDEIRKIAFGLNSLRSELVSAAKSNIHAVMPGYTHMQHAQPVSLAQHLLAYYEMFSRDFAKLINAYKTTDVLTLGSGALAGADFDIDRHGEAETLGFASVSRNSMDAVSDRDFAIEFNFSLSMIMLHLSRFCEELIIWNTPEFGFITLKDEFTTGSSIMPQKKNPDVLELIRGKTGGVVSNMLSLLMMMKALPLTYNRDMQEDKKPVMESAATVYSSVSIFTEIVKTITFHHGRLLDALGDDSIYATDVATYLVKKGIPFRKSHEIAGRIVGYAEGAGKKISMLTIAEFKKISNSIENDIFNIFSPASSVNSKKTTGGTSFMEIKASIRLYEKDIRKDAKLLGLLK